MTLIVGKIVRQNTKLVLQDDPAAACYRVTCQSRYCFDQPNERGQDGLHELVVDYSEGGKREALKDARRQFNEHMRFVERCEAPNCEWCAEDEEVRP